jgi:hypothetical protein
LEGGSEDENAKTEQTFMPLDAEMKSLGGQDSNRVIPVFDPNTIKGVVMYYKEIVACANWWSTT